jgi:hypothetical protein
MTNLLIDARQEFVQPQPAAATAEAAAGQVLLRGSPWRLRHYVVNMTIRTSDDVGQFAADAAMTSHAKGQ